VADYQMAGIAEINAIVFVRFTAMGIGSDVMRVTCFFPERPLG
jgi:hypothetical protein